MKLFATCAGTILAMWCGAATAQTAPSGNAAAGPTSRTCETSLKFDRNSLQGALELLSERIDVPIELVTKDFQLNGITGCQSHGLDEPKQPVEDLLKKILVTFDRDDRLAYTVRPDPQGLETVYIVVRKEAAKRGDTLFSEFKIGRK